MAASSHIELLGQYEDFLRGDRYNYVDQISTAIDDFFRISQNMNGIGKAGWSFPRLRYVFLKWKIYSESR